jgi:AAA domain-containing protein
MSPSATDHREKIEREAETVLRRAMSALEAERSVVVVRAPPGSGKTYLLSQMVSALRAKKNRIAIAAQTNAQADDICHRLATAPWNLSPYRFVARGGGMEDSVRQASAGKVIEVEDFDDLPHDPCIAVATTAKWGFVSIKADFDVLLVDEAWQMQWSQFVPLGRIASRFVLIGDPGQIPPVVAVDASRWETAGIPPHLPAPEIICSNPRVSREVRPVELRLPASRRLPADAVDLLQPFYDFSFAAWALPAERAVLANGTAAEPIDHAIDLLREASVVAVTTPTVDDLPPADMDDEVADLVAHVAARLLERKARVRILDDGAIRPERPITPADIAITATHRIMNELIAERLRRSEQLQEIRVDTPERWQGLQRLVTIAVHPLSGMLQPSSFDLETGRLCVMASRHRGGLVVVGRDHIGDTLDALIVGADQPLGRPDVAGRGHYQHLTLWKSLEAQDRIVSL